MTGAILLAVLAMAGPSVQDNLDTRWVPWLGCWELVDDQRRDPLIGEADPTQGQGVPVRGLVCLTPAAGTEGVSVTTIADGESFLEETLIANGENNPSSKGQCTGWQKTEWSDDGHRLFTSAELTCDGSRNLKVSGLSMMVPRSTWVDVQIVESDAGRAVLIRRYRPADDQESANASVTTALDANLAHIASEQRYSRALSAPLSADDIAEAASKVAPEALEAAVLEHAEGFDLSAESLIRLDDAGLRPGLIDLMVALSYPEQFQVSSGSGDASGGGGGFAIPGTYFGPTLPYSYGLPYHVTPFGYYYWYAPYDSQYVVRPVATRAVRQGLVSKQGYARVSPRATGRRARRRGSSSGSSGSASGSGSRSSSGSSSVSSGSSSGVSSSGYTRGSGSSRTRKARRRKD